MLCRFAKGDKKEKINIVQGAAGTYIREGGIYV
jgi:hypothetical protein